jgi:prepilin-type N-terminal cleavage/methylation domain-containing protein
MISSPTSRASRERRAGRGGRASSRSRAARAASAGFTLIELMVVVVLIAILAVLAAPALRVARDDRMAFDYARQIQQMAQRARARAGARGAAHLVLAGPSGTRGRVTMWEALDNTSVASGGPNPVSSCKAVGQWAVPAAFAGGAVGAPGFTRLIAGLELDTLGVNVDADITASFFIANDTTIAIPTTPVAALAICYTPSGTTFVAGDTDTATAITDMQTQSPFTGVADIAINRHSAAAAVVGLTRHVLIPGSAPARILSK